MNISSSGMGLGGSQVNSQGSVETPNISGLKAQQAKGVGERAFTYPGPKPQTLEQAILMMVDAVEAASRSLPEYTEESINTMVEKIIGAQVNEGNFSECAITFREIAETKEVLCTRLRTVYHTRIQYPD